MVVNERLMNQVRNCLADCGYQIEEPHSKKAAFHIRLDGEDIGYMDKDGAYHLMEDYAGERERLNNILNFANDFRYYPDRIDGELKIATFNNMIMTAQLNPQKGTPEFHICELDETGHIAASNGSFQNFEQAKHIFATQSRLYNPDFTAHQQERAIIDKFRQLAQSEHYQFKEIDHPMLKWEITSKNQHPVGYISLDNKFVAVGKSKKQRDHINSLYAQAKWEVSKERNGQSYLLQKITDALTKLSFTIKHVWQRLTMTAIITHNQTPVGAINPNGEPTYSPQATPKWKNEIEMAVKQAKEEIRTEFEHFSKTQTIDGIQTQNTGEASSAQAVSEQSTNFTHEEMLLIKALLASTVCKELVQKTGLQDVVTSLNDKIKDQFPQIPDYSKHESQSKPALMVIHPDEEIPEPEE